MSEEKLLFLLCFISETYQRKPNKNYFSSFSVFHTETECCTIMAIWGRRNVFSVYHMFLQTVVKVMFACSNVVVFCSLTGKKKKKMLTLLLESNSAKDLVCLIIGYYRLFVDANASIFTWGEKRQQPHRVSAEEG